MAGRWVVYAAGAIVLGLLLAAGLVLFSPGSVTGSSKARVVSVRDSTRGRIICASGDDRKVCGWVAAEDPRARLRVGDCAAIRFEGEPWITPCRDSSSDD